jgi:uncharacterized protein YabN with tetrapyrrole methylase and pyrophosphatase domain
MNHLTVAGLGIKDLLQMTIEARQALLEADQVLYLGTEPQRHLPQLKDWGIKSIRSILELYVDGAVDDQNYQRLYQEILKTAQTHAHTVLIVPGHPRIGVTLVQRLVKNPQDLDVQVLPGISSFDTMINDLARDPLEKGSVMVDANRMLLFEMVWPSSVDSYLYHVCSVGTRKVHVHDAQKDNAWDLLKEHLLKIYNPQTKVQLISSATHGDREPQKFSAPLGQLEGLKPFVHFGTTMYIAGENPKRINKEFYDHLKGEIRDEKTA